MSKNNETMEEKLARIKKEKEQARAGAPKENLMGQLIHEEEATTNFEKIAAEFAEMSKDKKSSVNEDYQKDTIYIKKPLYEAFNALCVNHGDKKRNVNQALEDFVLKKYREMKK